MFEGTEIWHFCVFLALICDAFHKTSVFSLKSACWPIWKVHRAGYSWRHMRPIIRLSIVYGGSRLLYACFTTLEYICRGMKTGPLVSPFTVPQSQLLQEWDPQVFLWSRSSCGQSCRSELPKMQMASCRGLARWIFACVFPALVNREFSMQQRNLYRAAR